MAKAKIIKTINKLIEENAKLLRENKIKPNKFLKLIIGDIINLKNEGYDYKTINEIINNTFDIKINYTTFYRWVKRNINDNANAKTIENSANALQGKENPSKSLKTQKKDINNNKGAKAPDTNQVKGGQNESTVKKRFDIEEYMNSNDGDNLFQKYNEF